MSHAETPLHELVELARENGLAIDFSIYSDKDGSLSHYEAGVRITGSTADPMDVMRQAVKWIREAMVKN